jgi:hypothetical protein
VPTPRLSPPRRTSTSAAGAASDAPKAQLRRARKRRHRPATDDEEGSSGTDAEPPVKRYSTRSAVKKNSGAGENRYDSRKLTQTSEFGKRTLVDDQEEYICSSDSYSEASSEADSETDSAVSGFDDSSESDSSYEDKEPKKKKQSSLPEYVDIMNIKHPSSTKEGFSPVQELHDIINEDYSKKEIADLLVLLHKLLGEFIEMFGEDIAQAYADSVGEQVSVDSALVGQQKKAWMSGDKFVAAAEHIMKGAVEGKFPGVPKMKKGKRALIILDNVSSHHDRRFVHVCAKNNIDILYLYPNSTGHAQPLDVGTNRAIKNNCYNLCTDLSLLTRAQKEVVNRKFPYHERHIIRIRISLSRLSRHTILNSFLQPLFKSHLHPSDRKKEDTIPYMDEYHQIRNGTYKKK